MESRYVTIPALPPHLVALKERGRVKVLEDLQAAITREAKERATRQAALHETVKGEIPGLIPWLDALSLVLPKGELFPTHDVSISIPGHHPIRFRLCWCPGGKWERLPWQYGPLAQGLKRLWQVYPAGSGPAYCEDLGAALAVAEIQPSSGDAREG